MSDYLDNQQKWSWNITKSKATIVTDHGNHTHTLNVTHVPIGQMVDHPGKVLGDAHRAASHDFKDDVNKTTNDIDDKNVVNLDEDKSIEQSTQEFEDNDNVVEDCDEECNEECDDELDV